MLIDDIYIYKSARDYRNILYTGVPRWHTYVDVHADIL